MPDINEKTKFGIDLKTLLLFGSLVIAGTTGYITQKIKTDTLQSQVLELKQEIKDSNLKVLEYKVDEIIKKIDELGK